MNHPVARTLFHAVVDAVYRLRALPDRLRRPASRIAVFYLYADTAKYPTSRQSLERALKRLSADQVTLFAIDNFALAPFVERRSPTLIELSGDNSQWEFSGWKRGIDVAGSLDLQFDQALFVNDSFLVRAAYGFDQHWVNNTFNSLTLRNLRRAALGCVHTCSSARPADICSVCDPRQMIDGWRVSGFLCTHAYAMDYETAVRLRWTSMPDDLFDRLCPREFSGRLFTDDPFLSTELKAHITWFLTEEWHSRRPVTAATWPLIREKIRAMLNERLMTRDLLSHGVRLLNSEGAAWWRGVARITAVDLDRPSDRDRPAPGLVSQRLEHAHCLTTPEMSDADD